MTDLTFTVAVVCLKSAGGGHVKAGESPRRTSLARRPTVTVLASNAPEDKLYGEHMHTVVTLG